MSLTRPADGFLMPGTSDPSSSLASLTHPVDGFLCLGPLIQGNISASQKSEEQQLAIKTKPNLKLHQIVKKHFIAIVLKDLIIMIL